MCRTKKAPRGALDYFMAGGEGAGILQSEQFDAWLNLDKHDNEALQMIIEQCSAGGMSVYPVSPAIKSGRVRFRNALSQ
jgi:putative SOS response-associated peptidase YedK